MQKEEKIKFLSKNENLLHSLIFFKDKIDSKIRWLPIDFKQYLDLKNI